MMGHVTHFPLFALTVRGQIWTGLEFDNQGTVRKIDRGNQGSVRKIDRGEGLVDRGEG